MTPKNLDVITFGPDDDRRYYIVDEDHTYWNEKDQTWTKNPKEAGVFADEAEVGSKMHQLMVTQVPGIVQRFVAPIIVEVKTTEPITVEALAKWLEKAVRVLPAGDHGNGPTENSMILLRMDWPQLEDISEPWDDPWVE